MTTRRLCTAFLATLVILTASRHAAAQDQTVDDVRRELAVLRAEVAQLRAELLTLRDVIASARPAAPMPLRLDVRTVAASPASLVQEPVTQPALELLQTQLAELSQVKVESTSRMPVKVFGTIHMNAFANSGAPNWLDIPNLVGQRPADGFGGTFSATLRQTRLGFTVDGPTLNEIRTSGAVAFDFFGGIPGFATGQVMGLPRLLVAYARFDGERTAAQIGQDHMILAPLDPTSLAAFAFPALFRSGNLYLRTPQARLERALGSRLRVTGGIVAPIGGDVTVEDYRFVPPALSGERSRRPALQTRFAYADAAVDESRHINAAVAAHYGWERRAATLAESSAIAVDFSVRRDVIGAAGELFVGNNIDAFGGAAGLDARAAGGWAELQVFPTARLSLAAGGGRDDLRGRRPLTLPRRRNRSAYGAALFSLSPEVQLSFEYHWLATLPGTGDERRNHHFDWVLAYRF